MAPAPTALATDAWAILDAAPEAFAAVDADLAVIAWNAAAEQLTGFSAADVLGGPLPHLTPAQRTELVAALPSFDAWAADVPITLPRRHADGRTIEVCVTRYMRLSDAEGRPAGFASFFRAVRTTDPRTHLRNTYSQRLASSVRTEDVLAALDMIVVELLRGQRGYLLRRDADGWRGWLATGGHVEVAEGISVRDEDALDRAVAGGRWVRTTIDIAGDRTPVLAVPAGPRSAATVLALVGVRPRGGAEEGLALALASEAWAALRRVDAMDELEAKVEILEAIAGVASVAGLDTRSVLEHVARQAASALSCDRTAIYLWDATADRLELAAFSASDRHAGDAWPLDGRVHALGRQAADAMAAVVRDTGRPFVAQDATAHPWLAGPWSAEEGTVSVEAVQLHVGDRPIGLLVAAHTDARPRGFTALCTQISGALARQAALAISDAQLYDAQREAAERFARADQQRAEWVAGITHDLRSPITAVVGFARTLSRAGDRLSPEDQADALDVIERQSLRVSRMLEDMMDAARAQVDELRPDLAATVDLAHCVAEAVAVTTPEDRQRVTVVGRGPVVVCGDQGQLTRVVQNLVVNALVHTPTSSPVEVRVDVDEDAAEGVVAVVDHGPGLPTDVDLFSPYARGPEGGTGLGLFTVRRILELHGGRIDTTVTPLGGATLVIRLPLAPAGGACDAG